MAILLLLLSGVFEVEQLHPEEYRQNRESYEKEYKNKKEAICKELAAATEQKDVPIEKEMVCAETAAKAASMAAVHQKESKAVDPAREAVCVKETVKMNVKTKALSSAREPSAREGPALTNQLAAHQPTIPSSTSRGRTEREKNNQPEQD